VSIEAMKQALEALDHEANKGNDNAYQCERDALRAAIEQAEQPVAWQGVHDHTDLYYRKPPQADVRPLYTTPPAAPRKWVGLTDEGIVELIKPAMRYYGYNPDHAVLTSGAGFVELADAIEAKLKEKNAA